MPSFFSKGLKSKEIQNLQANIENESNSTSIYKILNRNLFNLFNLILLPLSALLFLVDKPGDALFNCVFVFANAAIGIYQEIKAKKTLDQLKIISISKATVVRDNSETLIPVNSIVLDDLVKSSAGEQITVDGTVVYAKNALVDESLMTGETDYIKKSDGEKVTSGTFVITGELYYKATAVGENRFSSLLLQQSKKLISTKTTLEKQIDKILNIFLFCMFVLIILQLLSQFFKYSQSADEFNFSNLILNVSTIVSALVPIGLVLVTTISYAAASRKMLEAKVLVNKISAVEAIAHIDVLCMDKTGTITTNEIRFDEFIQTDKTVNKDLVSSKLKLFSQFASNPNRTMLAIRSYFEFYENKSEIRALKEKPFESKSKFSAVSFSDNSTLYIGAPEVLLKFIDSETSEIFAKINEYFTKGKRCLIAVEDRNSKNFEIISSTSLKILGILVLEDKIRDEASKVIDELYQRNIDIKIISGDNHDSVASIAKAIGIRDVQQISGIDLQNFTNEEFNQAVMHFNVFGRISPEQKREIIEVLQNHGKNVGMIGDGVNDVISIKKADLGIAMNSGSQMAKDVADMVLLDNSFASIPVVISQGNQIYSNIVKVSKLFVGKSILFAIILLLFICLSLDSPFTPRQFNLINTIIVAFPSIAIALLPLYKDIPKSFYYSVFRFSFMSGLTFALVGFLVYISSNLLNSENNRFDTSAEVALISQTALVTSLLIAGLTNVAFVTLNKLKTKEVIRSNRFIVVMILVSFGVYLSLISVPLTRDFFGVGTMNALTYFTTFAITSAGVLIFYFMKTDSTQDINIEIENVS